MYIETEALSASKGQSVLLLHGLVFTISVYIGIVYRTLSSLNDNQ